MNNKILNRLKTTSGALVFSLLCGLAYFMLAAYFVLSTTRNGTLLLLFTAPMIICGMALIVIKLVKQNFEKENDSANLRIFYLHAVLFAVSLLFAIAAIM